jgi:hypothetical protein
MIRYMQLCAAAVLSCELAAAALTQSVYPTGTTVYDPSRSWNGFRPWVRRRWLLST